MAELQEKSGTLVVLRCWCGIQHAVPESLRGLQERQHHNGEPQESIYCPLGHQHQIAGPSQVSRLSAQLTQERARHDQTKAALRETEARRRRQKAANTRLKARVAKGICPSCHRTFVNVQRHMARKHPEYGQSDSE